NTEGEQTTDFRVFVEYHRLNAVAYQYVGTAKARRAGTDNGHALTSRNDFGHIRTPAHREGGVGDVLFDVTDGHGTEAVVEGTGPFTQTVLRTYTTTHFRQGVGRMTQFHRFQNVALAGQFQPVRDVV